MSVPTGKFVWYDLITVDKAPAAEFYRAVIGWQMREMGADYGHYTVLSTGETGVGGMVTLQGAGRDAGIRPGWIGYVAVDDVDAFAARVAAGGGRVLWPATDIPAIGRFAYVADPQGAVFTLFMPLPGAPAPPEAEATPGRIGWHELHAADREGAFAFYAGLFGWTKTQAIDMGPMGSYQTFAAGGTGMTGGMMRKGDTIPAPCWLYYINVDDIDAAVGRAKASGGRLLQGPHQVPGGSWIAQCLDPQGTLFAMVGPNVTPA